MINLLPDETKRDIRAARMNVVLLRYNLITLGAVALLAGFCLLFYVILHNNQSMAENTTNDNSLKAASYNDVRKAADEYRNNLSIASKILNNGITYTDVINSITKLVPSGVILDSINLTSTQLGQQTSFSAHAKTYENATKLKENFQSSPLYSNVYFQTLSSGATDGTSTADYTIAVTISAKLNKVVNP
jgi:hypothetical protein